MLVSRSVTVDRRPEVVFAYLADFTTTTIWDPATVGTTRLTGSGGVGTRYLNRSRFLGRTTELIYEVVELVPGRRISLRGENATIVALDTMTVEPAGSHATVTYRAEFTFRGVSRLAAPLLAPALRRLADRAEIGLRSALQALPERGDPEPGDPESGDPEPGAPETAATLG